MSEELPRRGDVVKSASADGLGLVMDIQASTPDGRGVQLIVDALGPDGLPAGAEVWMPDDCRVIDDDALRRRLSELGVRGGTIPGARREPPVGP